MSATGFEQDLAASNGVFFRHWATPVGFKGNGALAVAEFAETRLEGGKLMTTDRRLEIQCDAALIAIGQSLDPSIAVQFVVNNGRIAVGPDYQTSVPGVYAGGDCIERGEDLTVRAVEDGKRAAIAVDRALRTKGAAR